MKVLVLIVFVVFAGSQAHKGFGEGEQDWGYVEVRKGAHMFWWLYFTSATEEYTQRPLVIWLQGGPGASSTGYGNFIELGPLDEDLKPRNHTWIKDVNVLFVDNPVGSGFSYVDSDDLLVTTNKVIAADFVEFLKEFYAVHPEFKPVPLYIVGESYAGKMIADIALLLDKAIKSGNISCNLIGIGLGDSWLDPVGIALEWAPYLLAVGAVDQAGHDAVATATLKTKEMFDRKEYASSSNQTRVALGIICAKAHGINNYNILEPISADKDCSKQNLDSEDCTFGLEDSKIEKICNVMPNVKQALNLNVTWKALNWNVYHTLNADFMKGVTEVIQEILDNTNIKVAVYNGQLDLIVATPGIVKWLDNLKWKLSDQWHNASRKAIPVNGIYEGYQKIVSNLAMFWVNRAGHMVPADNPAAMDYILRWLTQDYDGTIKRPLLI